MRRGSNPSGRVSSGHARAMARPIIFQVLRQWTDREYRPKEERGMKQQQTSKWEETRARGMWRFLLVWTLLLGGAMIAATGIFDYFVKDSRPVLENMKIRAPILLVSAFVGGLALWFLSEWRYKKSDSDTDTKG